MPQKPNKKPNILVVDDEQVIRDLFLRILKNEEYNIITAKNGKEAIRKVKETPFEIIFLDIRMPGMDGVETYRRIKKANPEAKVFTMTAFDVPEQVEKALAEGASGSLFKPFDVSEVVRVVKKQPVSLAKLPVRNDDMILLLDTKDIFYINAKGNWVNVYTYNQAFRARFALTELEKRLTDKHFFRTHRSYIVNLDKVKGVVPLSRTGISLVMTDEKESKVFVSRSRTKQLKNLLAM